MKIALTSIFFFSTITICLAQLDNPNNNSAVFEQTENTVNTPTGLELPAIKKPSLSNSDYRFNPKETSTLGEEEEKLLDMSKDDGLLKHKTDKAPKYFTKDKEADEKYGRDQFLGEHKSNGAYVNVVYRDHEYVDGDRIRVLVNDDIVQFDISLDGTFRGFDLNLEKGTNRIEFLALNQGSSGPNTAELHVYDDQGVLVSAHEWNLLTGNKASVVIVKE